jgi:hypothetical protein
MQHNHVIMIVLTNKEIEKKENKSYPIKPGINRNGQKTTVFMNYLYVVLRILQLSLVKQTRENTVLAASLRGVLSLFFFPFSTKE